MSSFKKLFLQRAKQKSKKKRKKKKRNQKEENIESRSFIHSYFFVKNILEICKGFGQIFSSPPFVLEVKTRQRAFPGTWER